MAGAADERGKPRSASDDVEADVGALPDPEGGPQNPAGALALGALLSPRERRAQTRGEILRLAWPVMLSMLLASIVGAVDVLMVKRLGAVAQAAVGVGAQVFMLAQAVLFALSFACVALMARAIGAGQSDRARHALAAALVLALVTSLLLFATFGIEPGWILALIGIEPAVAAATTVYLRLVMAASILMGLCLTIESALRANRDTVTPMLITVVVTATKIGLNPLLIYGVAGTIPPLGLAGAGWATLGAQCVALLAFAFVTLRAPADGPLGVRPRDFRPARAMIVPLVRVSLPGVGERLILQVAMLTYLTAVGSFGTYATAAYSIGVRLLSFSWIPGNGFSQAAATIVGQSLGAGDLAKADARREARREPCSRRRDRDGCDRVLRGSPDRRVQRRGPGDRRGADPVHDVPRLRAAVHAAALHAGRRVPRRGRHLDAAGFRADRQLGVPRAVRVAGDEGAARRPDLGVGRVDARPRGARALAAVGVPASRLVAAPRRDSHEDLTPRRTRVLTLKRHARAISTTRSCVERHVTLCVALRSLPPHLGSVPRMSRVSGVQPWSGKMHFRKSSILGALAVALQLLLGAQAASAVGIMRITEWMYNGDEFIEFTNVGDASIDLTGWSFDDDSRAAGTVSLSAFGVVAAGQSVILAESTATAFRTAWGLAASVSVIGGNGTNLGRGDEINLYDASNGLVDRLTYNDQAAGGGPRTLNVSGNILAANLGANAASLVVLSSLGDAFGSVTSSATFLGNPGSYPAVVPEPAAFSLLGLSGAALLAARRRGRHSA